jgi:hypothetical protein
MDFSFRDNINTKNKRASFFKEIVVNERKTYTNKNYDLK